MDYEITNSFTNLAPHEKLTRGFGGKNAEGFPWYDMNIQDLKNIYVSWGFFEDEILNKELSLGFGEKYELIGKFDSSESFVRYDDALLARQELNMFF